MSLIPGYLYSILVSTIWAVGCLGLGLIWSRRFRNLNHLENYLTAFLIGCISWIFIGYILFIFHVFKPAVVITLVYLSGIGSFVLFGKQFLSDIKGRIKFDYQIYCLMSALIFQAIYTFLPVTAFDALFYHLPLAERMLQTGTISWTPWIINSALPQNYELLQAVALATGGYVTVNLLSSWFSTTTIFTLIAIGIRLGNWRIGLWSGIALSLTPLWFWYTYVPYLETFLAFGFCFMALCLIIDAPGLLVGLTAGWLCGTKYWGLEAASIGFLIWLIKCRPNSRNVSFAFLTAFAISGFWYVRNIYMFSNPFFPFYSELFKFMGSPRVDGAIATAYEFPRVHDSPSTLIGWLRLPFKLMINPVPEYCEDTAQTWKFVGFFSFFWLFSLITAYRNKMRILLPVLAYVFIALFSWIVLHRFTYLRYLTVILPLMYLLSFVFLSMSLSRFKISLKTQSILAIVFILVFIWHLFGFTTTRSVYQVPLTSDERNIFLDSNIDGWFAMDKLNQLKPKPTVYFLYGEGVRFYCDFPPLPGGMIQTIIRNSTLTQVQVMSLPIGSKRSMWIFF
jgi:hypothetical protein